MGRTLPTVVPAGRALEPTWRNTRLLVPTGLGLAGISSFPVNRAGSRQEPLLHEKCPKQTEKQSFSAVLDTAQPKSGPGLGTTPMPGIGTKPAVKPQVCDRYPPTESRDLAPGNLKGSRQGPNNRVPSGTLTKPGYTLSVGDTPLKPVIKPAKTHSVLAGFIGFSTVVKPATPLVLAGFTTLYTIYKTYTVRCLHRYIIYIIYIIYSLKPEGMLSLAVYKGIGLKPDQREG